MAVDRLVPNKPFYQVADRIGSVPFKTRQRLRRDLDPIRLLLQKRAKENAPVRTGRLRRSIRAILTDTGGTVRLTLTAGNREAFYAGFVEYGTRYMRPRYYLRRTFNDKLLLKTIRVAIARAVDTATKGA